MERAKKYLTKYTSWFDKEDKGAISEALQIAYVEGKESVIRLAEHYSSDETLGKLIRQLYNKLD